MTAPDKSMQSTQFAIPLKEKIDAKNIGYSSRRGPASVDIVIRRGRGWDAVLVGAYMQKNNRIRIYASVPATMTDAANSLFHEAASERKTGHIKPTEKSHSTVPQVEEYLFYENSTDLPFQTVIDRLLEYVQMTERAVARVGA